MTMLLQEPIRVRQARSIRNRTEEISDDLATAEAAIQDLSEEMARLVQSNVWGVLSLANQWKSFIAAVNAGMNDNSISNYRELASILQPAAETYARICENVQNSVMLIAKTCANVKLEDVADLDLAQKDAGRYQRWLACWPSSTHEQLDDARKSYLEGSGRPWREAMQEVVAGEAN